MAPALLLALTGCGLPANVVVLLPDENGTVGKVAVHEGGSTAELNKPLAAVNAGSEASLHNVFTAQRSDVDSEFAGALAAAPRAPLVYILYFQTGSTELDPRSRGDLAAAIAAAKGTANVDISVVGHADATGSDAYNSALSLKTRPDRARRPCRSGRSERDHRNCLSRGEQSARTDATRSPGAAQQARRGHYPLRFCPSMVPKSCRNFRQRAICLPSMIEQSRCMLIVVEDDDGVRVLVEELLLDRGYNVVSAPNGAEGLDQIQREPRLSLADHRHPHAGH